MSSFVIWSAPGKAQRRRRFGLFGVPPLGGFAIKQRMPPTGGTPNQGAFRTLAFATESLSVT